jgi:hypothetical protein
MSPGSLYKFVPCNPHRRYIRILLRGQPRENTTQADVRLARYLPTLSSDWPMNTSISSAAFRTLNTGPSFKWPLIRKNAVGKPILYL